MKITPGLGTPSVRLGEERNVVEARLGAPTSVQPGVAFYTDLDPDLVVRYSDAGIVELIEIPYSSPGHQVTLRGIQLTLRPIDDVIEDLRSTGYVGRPSDVGFDFSEGFAIWSMGSLAFADIDASASDEDERLVVEGVSVGAPAYFGF